MALVVMGAVACTENESSVDDMQAGLSFYAEIVSDATRADLEYDADNNVWNTVWEGNEELTVFDPDYKRFTFKNSPDNPNKFTCLDPDVEAHLLGKRVVIESEPISNSTDGRKAWYVYTVVSNFSVDESISLQTQNSYFRFTYNGSGSLTLALNPANADNEDDMYVAKSFVFNVYERSNEITLDNIEGEQWLAVYPGIGDDGHPMELSFAIDGVVWKTALIENYKWGKVYNLGELSIPYEVSTFTVPGVHNGWDTSATPMYIVGDYHVAFGVETSEFKVLGNGKWYGANDVALNTWTDAGAEDSFGNITLEAGCYDIYFSEAESKVCVVNAGDEVSAMPLFSIGVVGLGGNWDTDIDMTLEGDYYTLKGVNIADTDSFKLRTYDAWKENYGIASTEASESVAINYDAMYTLVQDGKNMQVVAGTYDLYFNYQTKEFYVLTQGTLPEDLAIPQHKIYLYQFNNSWSPVNLYTWDGNTNQQFTGDWPGTTTPVVENIGGYDYLVWTMPRIATGKSLCVIANNGTEQTGDFVLGNFDKDYYLLLNGTELSFVDDRFNPEPEVVEPEVGVATEWALVGAFSSWADKAMLSTADANVVVYAGVELKAAEGFLVRKPSTEWADKYGAGDVNYIKANHYITTTNNGADMCVEADGTYDVYFDISTKNLYVMEAGADYANATKQTVNGEEPKQEEPEVTEKVVYLKPNSNWTQSNARFAAYFWNNSGNVWVSMTAVGDGTYEVHLPEGYDYGCNVIFCRMNPSTTANNWNNKWNQTSDLKTPTDGKNLYTVKDGTWDGGGGTWSVK